MVDRGVFETTSDLSKKEYAIKQCSREDDMFSKQDFSVQF